MTPDSTIFPINNMILMLLHKMSIILRYVVGQSHHYAERCTTLIDLVYAPMPSVNMQRAWTNRLHVHQAPLTEIDDQLLTTQQAQCGRDSLVDSGGDIGEVVAGTLEEVVPEEESSQRVLDTATHLHQVLEDVLLDSLLGLDVHQSHRHQQVSAETYHTQWNIVMHRGRLCLV